MARHELPAKDPAHKVIVAWDDGMSAFVGVVRDRETGRRRKLVVVPHISDLKARIRRYAEFPTDMWEKLKADRGGRKMSRQFSKEIERAAFFRCRGRCHGCSAKLASGDIHYDHVVPWALSCDSSLANCQVLCKTCHGLKTADRDIPAITKAKNQSDFHQGITGP